MTLAEHSPRVAVVLPAYNESAHIADVIASIPDWVTWIFVVNDASTDDTSRVAAGIDDARVSVVDRTANGGVGAATLDGYRAALLVQPDVVVKMDADGQMNGNELARLVYPIVVGSGDYAKGNRFRSNQTVGRRMPWIRTVGSVGLSFFTKMSSGYWHVFDSQCGFTAISGHALGLLDLDSISHDYFFENDMLIKLNELDVRVIDVPIASRYGSEVSNLSITKVLLTFPIRLLVAAWRRSLRRYFVLDFGAPGLLLFFGGALSLFGLTFGGYHWWLSNASGVAATTGTVMVAVLPLIVGIQLLVQAFAMEVGDSPGAPETRHYARLLISGGDPSW